jgi:hypothetical protein
LPADDNERATRLILAQIAGDSSCAALFHLGDITSASSEDGQWEIFDAAAEPLRQARIPISPAFGNHEYLFVADEGVYNAETRFPALRRQWYVRRIGPMAVILLNSNFSRLTQEECLRQEEWYERSLDSLDADSSVAAVVVGCHHPPYTNSRIASPSEEVQREFLPAFFNSRKAKLFLSGHAHTFEHFVIGKKDFLVIGGGGGLLHPLLPPGEQRWPDQFPHAGERSFFHYLRVRCGEDRLSVEVMALDNTSGTFSIVHRLEIVCAPR